MWQKSNLSVKTDTRFKIVRILIYIYLNKSNLSKYAFISTKEVSVRVCLKHSSLVYRTRLSLLMHNKPLCSTPVQHSPVEYFSLLFASACTWAHPALQWNATQTIEDIKMRARSRSRSSATTRTRMATTTTMHSGGSLFPHQRRRRHLWGLGHCGTV